MLGSTNLPALFCNDAIRIFGPRRTAAAATRRTTNSTTQQQCHRQDRERRSDAGHKKFLAKQNDSKKHQRIQPYSGKTAVTRGLAKVLTKANRPLTLSLQSSENRNSSGNANHSEWAEKQNLVAESTSLRGVLSVLGGLVQELHLIGSHGIIAFSSPSLPLEPTHAIAPQEFRFPPRLS